MYGGEGERERERERDIYIYIHIHYMHIYIHIIIGEIGGYIGVLFDVGICGDIEVPQ